MQYWWPQMSDHDLKMIAAADRAITREDFAAFKPTQ